MPGHGRKPLQLIGSERGPVPGRRDSTTREIASRIGEEPALIALHDLEDALMPAIQRSIVAKADALARGETPQIEGAREIVGVAVMNEVPLGSLQRAYRIAYAVQIQELIAQLPMRLRADARCTRPAAARRTRARA